MANEQGNPTSHEEQRAAKEFEAGEGGIKENEISESTKEAIDFAWRAEGLEKVMRQKGDKRATQLEINVMTIFAETTSPGKPVNEAELSNAAGFIKALCEEYKYDSGKRKYGKE
ncbi:MAG: hypothetical protein V1668_02620 [Patescibacteria group bacterium]